MRRPIGDRAETGANVRWMRESWAAMRPFRSAAAYLNDLDADEPGRVGAAYGAAKYARLAALKQKYDPDDFFRLDLDAT